MTCFVPRLRTCSAALAAVLTVAACEPAPVTAEDQAQATRLSSEFQRICGVLARTGDLNATKKAISTAGYTSDGIVQTTHGSGFKNFEHFTKGSIQVQVTDQTVMHDGVFCSVVAEPSSSVMPDALFKATASAIASANGKTLSSPPAFRLNEYGTHQFDVGGRFVRLAHQSYPAALVLYTFTSFGAKEGM